MKNKEKTCCGGGCVLRFVDVLGEVVGGGGGPSKTRPREPGHGVPMGTHGDPMASPWGPHGAPMLPHFPPFDPL